MDFSILIEKRRDHAHWCSHFSVARSADSQVYQALANGLSTQGQRVSIERFVKKTNGILISEAGDEAAEKQPPMWHSGMRLVKFPIRWILGSSFGFERNSSDC
jgi:hypothetical protein